MSLSIHKQVDLLTKIQTTTKLESSLLFVTKGKQIFENTYFFNKLFSSFYKNWNRLVLPLKLFPLLDVTINNSCPLRLSLGHWFPFFLLVLLVFLAASTKDEVTAALRILQCTGRSLIYAVPSAHYCELEKTLLLEFKETVGLFTNPNRWIQWPKINQKNNGK